MIQFNIKVADFVFKIHCSYSECRDLCKDYLTDEKECFDIVVQKEDIVFEQEKSYSEAKYEGIAREVFPDSYLETIAVYRKIADYISAYDTNVFHGALIQKDNEGYLFTAKSGTGKTTHINNWLKEFKDCSVINGDKPILKIVNNEVIAYGTPWSGKENLNTNAKVKLKAIIVLTRDETNHIEEIKTYDVLPILMSQTYRASKQNERTLKFVIELAKRVKLYKLGCNMEKESARVAYNGMNQ